MKRNEPGELIPTEGVCANCGAPLYGAYCYHCGQSVKSLIRHLPALAEDALDLVFNIDSRILRTLPALFVRPGYLTMEYFAGRRTRYIPPFRLMFFLSVMAFLVIQAAMTLPDSLFASSTPRERSLVAAQTRAEVQKQMDRALAQIGKTKADPDMPAIAREALDMSARNIRIESARRMAALDSTPATAASTRKTAADSLVGALASSPAARGYLDAITGASDAGQAAQRTRDAVAAIDTSLRAPGLTAEARRQLKALRSRIRDAGHQRVRELSTLPAAASLAARNSQDGLQALESYKSGWMPEFLAARIRGGAHHMRETIRQIRDGDPAEKRETLQRVLGNILSVLPQTMFVLLPLFAVLLKIVYLFKRRLYMEHLMVALHSHAFIFMSLLLVALLSLAKSAWSGWAAGLVGWLQIALWVWLPIYLLVMQKRVYRQGWFMTLLKYGFVSFCYTIMVTMAAAIAAMIGLAS